MKSYLKFLIVSLNFVGMIKPSKKSTLEFLIKDLENSRALGTKKDVNKI